MQSCCHPVWTTCMLPDDVWMTCGWHAEYVQITCGQHADIVCQWNLAWNLTLMSSTCHPHIVRMRFQPQKYFQLNSKATALLKMKSRFPLHKWSRSITALLKSLNIILFNPKMWLYCVVVLYCVIHSFCNISGLLPQMLFESHNCESYGLENHRASIHYLEIIDEAKPSLLLK